MVASRLCGRDNHDPSIKSLREWFSIRSDFRADLFWIELSFMTKLITEESSWGRFWNVIYHSLVGNLMPTDRAWVEPVLRDATDPSRQEVALQAWVWIWAREGANRRRLPAMRASLGPDQRLLSIFDERTQKSKESARTQRYERDSKRRQAEMDAKEDKRLKDWAKWRLKLKGAPKTHFGQGRINSTIHDLFQWLEQRGRSKSSYCVWNYHAIIEVFSPEVGELARTAFIARWRVSTPELWSERLNKERNVMPYSWVYGLCGVMAEAETPEWAKLLSSDDARLAARYATVEINGFAPFIVELARVKPTDVDALLGNELDAELTFGGSHSHLPVLQDLTHADMVLKNLLKPRLIAFLKRQVSFEAPTGVSHWAHNLDQILTILAETANAEEVKSIGYACIVQLKKAPNGSLALTWLRGIFRFTPEEGMALFINMFGVRQRSKSRDLATQAFARLCRHKIKLT